MIDVLILGGTWSAEGDPVTDAFIAGLDPARFRPRMVAYPADYGKQVSFAASKSAGLSELARAVAQMPNQVVVVGYSQGAGIAGDFVAEVGSGFYPGLLTKVLACGLIADPLRPHRAVLGADPGGYGILGQREVDRIPTYWVAASGDPITALSAGSPLRTVADLTEYWCLASPGAFVKWGQSINDLAGRRGWQRWWSRTSPQELAETADWTRQYLIEGRHTNAYITEGHCRRLADALVEEVSALAVVGW